MWGTRQSVVAAVLRREGRDREPRAHRHPPEPEETGQQVGVGKASTPRRGPVRPSTVGAARRPARRRPPLAEERQPPEATEGRRPAEGARGPVAVVGVTRRGPGARRPGDVEAAAVRRPATPRPPLSAVAALTGERGERGAEGR